MPDISYAKQLACLRRELAMRQRVYPGLVERRKMTPEKALEEEQLMAACIETLQRLADEETGQPWMLMEGMTQQGQI